MALKHVIDHQAFAGRTASEALTAYLWVKTNASSSEKIDQADTRAERTLGLIDQSWSSGDHCQVITAGVAKAIAGEVVAAGDLGMAGANARTYQADCPEVANCLILTAAAAAGDHISVLMLPQGGESHVRTVTRKFRITYADGTTETDTGFDLPAKAIVREVVVDVITAEATGGTKTIDVGTDGSGSNDPDGFLDGISVAATGIVKGAPTFTTGSNEVFFASSTVGALLAPVKIAGSDVATDVGTYYEDPKGDATSGGESLTWTPGSNDFAELVADIYITYTEIVA